MPHICWCERGQRELKTYTGRKRQMLMLGAISVPTATILYIYFTLPPAFTVVIIDYLLAILFIAWGIYRLFFPLSKAAKAAWGIHPRDLAAYSNQRGLLAIMAGVLFFLNGYIVQSLWVIHAPGAPNLIFVCLVGLAFCPFLLKRYYHSKNVPENDSENQEAPHGEKTGDAQDDIG